MNIVDALDAADGITCVVGAGGKKTTLATLGGQLDRAVITATVRIPIFDEWAGEVVITDDPVGAVERTLDETIAGESRSDASDSQPVAGDSQPVTGGSQPVAGDSQPAADSWPLGVVPEQEREDRYRGYEPETVDRIGDLGLPVLVKADGARMRKFKAPDEHEPRLPETADTVVSIASAHVVGEPLSEELVHRVPEVSAVTGLEPGDEITPADVAAVLASKRGGRKGVPAGATYVPLLNMVDDADLEATARTVAAEIHDRIEVPRVVLAEMRADDPVVDVV